jgi:hypothetical protein
MKLILNKCECFSLVNILLHVSAINLVMGRKDSFLLCLEVIDWEAGLASYKWDVIFD